jgi:hypothetical protein
MANNIIRGIIDKKDQKRIDTKKGPMLRTAYKIDGKFFSTLDRKLGAFVEGDDVELAYNISGDFNNITSGKLFEEDAAGKTEEEFVSDDPNTELDLPIKKTSTPSNNTYKEKAEYFADKERKIVRQNALSQANDFLKLVDKDISNKTSDEKLEYLFAVAKRCEEWVMRE